MPDRTNKKTKVSVNWLVRWHKPVQRNLSIPPPERTRSGNHLAASDTSIARRRLGDCGLHYSPYVFGHCVGLRGHPPLAREGELIVFRLPPGFVAGFILADLLFIQHDGGKHGTRNFGCGSL